jgi:hypothetical protein
MPPDNSGYALAAYGIVGAVYLGYTVSLWLRSRRIGQ